MTTPDNRALWELVEAATARITPAQDLYTAGYSDASRRFRDDLKAILECPVVVSDEVSEIERLKSIINTPQSDDFIRAVSIEAEHQRQRWSTTHDSGKAPADWFWLIGYLAGKALHAHASGNVDKAEHHIITTAAACANWHRAMFGKTEMRPGIDDEQALESMVRGKS